MSLTGGGAVCIWNDIAPESRSDFYAWHLHEHMPERAAIPGFRRGRRYVALDGATQPEFFTLYETDTTAVLTGADYLARLNAPTDWTRIVTQGFRNTSRALTRVRSSLGPGDGGVLATFRFGVFDGRESDAVRSIASMLPSVIVAAEICGAHLCVTDREASAEKTTESRERKDILAAPGWVILLEGCGESALRRASAELAARLAEIADGAPVLGHYRFEFAARART